MARGQQTKDAPGLIVAPLNDLTHASARLGLSRTATSSPAWTCSAARWPPTDIPAPPKSRPWRRRCAPTSTAAFARASVKSPVVQLADGTWINYVPCDAMTPRRLLEEWYPTDVDCGPLHLARLAAIDPRGWLATAMLHDHEDNLFLNQWGMANEPVYNQQATAYLYRDEPEAAIRAFYSMMACAFSHHQLTPLEHRWAWGQYYMPPSTDGAWFELYRNMLVNELSGDGTLFIGQAVPRAWLADGKRIRGRTRADLLRPGQLHDGKPRRRRHNRGDPRHAHAPTSCRVAGAPAPSRVQAHAVGHRQRTKLDGLRCGEGMGADWRSGGGSLRHRGPLPMNPTSGNSKNRTTQL